MNAKKANDKAEFSLYEEDIKLYLKAIFLKSQECCRIIIIWGNHKFSTLEKKKHSGKTISIISCFNNFTVLKYNLLASLIEQTEPFELILIDNTLNAFLCIPKALNIGGSLAAGKLIMFVHQDIYFDDSNSIAKFSLYKKTKNVGALGVMGITSTGQLRGFILDRGKLSGQPFKEPSQVQTLDELLIVVPKDVFEKERFDETFRFHSYVADYCLTLQEKGFSVYVIPAFIEHNSGTLGSLKASNINKDDALLFSKHKKAFSVIHKTTESYNANFLNNLASNIYYFLIRWFLRRNGVSTNKILDFGCIPAEQPFIVKMLKTKCYSVGVSEKKRYAVVSKQIGVHNDYVVCKPSYLPFQPKSFETVLLFGILENTSRSKSIDIISNAQIIGKIRIAKIPSNDEQLSNLLKSAGLCKRIFSSDPLIIAFKKINISKTHNKAAIASITILCNEC